ncbi:MAG: alpha/beta hydrolase [Legionella sp.]
MVAAAEASMTIRVESLSRNGLVLNLLMYQDAQIKPVKPYPDIVLVHGLTYSSYQYDINYQDYSLARALARNGYRVWLLDITGYGRSQKPENGFLVNSDYAAEDINAAVDHILEQYKVPKVTILGWSWGTITTSRFVAKYHEKVNKLILFAPILHAVALDKPVASYQAFSMDEALSDFQKNTLGEINPKIMDKQVLNLYIHSAQIYDSQGSPNGGRLDVAQAKNVQLIPYEAFVVPVLLIAGDKDPYLSIKRDFAIMTEHAKAKVSTYIIKGGGHALLLEKPYHRDFKQKVMQFLTCNENTIVEKR